MLRKLVLDWEESVDFTHKLFGSFFDRIEIGDLQFTLPRSLHATAERYDEIMETTELDSFFTKLHRLRPADLSDTQIEFVKAHLGYLLETNPNEALLNGEAARAGFQAWLLGIDFAFYRISAIKSGLVDWNNEWQVQKTKDYLHHLMETLDNLALTPEVKAFLSSLRELWTHESNTIGTQGLGPDFLSNLKDKETILQNLEDAIGRVQSRLEYFAVREDISNLLNRLGRPRAVIDKVLDDFAANPDIPLDQLLLPVFRDATDVRVDPDNPEETELLQRFLPEDLDESMREAWEFYRSIGSAIVLGDELFVSNDRTDRILIFYLFWLPHLTHYPTITEGEGDPVRISENPRISEIMQIMHDRGLTVPWVTDKNNPDNQLDPDDYHEDGTPRK